MSDNMEIGSTLYDKDFALLAMTKEKNIEHKSNVNEANLESFSLKTDKVEMDKEKVNFAEGKAEDFKFYPDNPENHRHKYRWAMKEPSKYYDPCEESRQASISCILRNQEDKLVCQEFFDAYRECKKDFFEKRRKDRLQGKGGWGFW